MEKREIGARTFLYPMPTVLVGAAVAGKPNYLAVAYIGIAQHAPPMIAFAMSKTHHTAAGIRETGTFSVNIPTEEQVAVTDYCGLVSGRRVDKSALFTAFYGKLATAPMIAECPLNLECRVVRSLDFGGNNELLVGEIVAAYAEERFLTDGLPDIQKIRPIVFSMHDNNYWKVGEHLAGAWSVGKTFRPPGSADDSSST